MAGTTRITVRVDHAAVREMTHGPSGLVRVDLARRGRRVESRAKVLCPVNRGRLRASISVVPVTIGGNPGVRIGSDVAYTVFVHNGTGIHGPRGRPIVPVTATVLSWQPRGGGRRVYARRSSGTPGRPFLTEALPAAG